MQGGCAGIAGDSAAATAAYKRASASARAEGLALFAAAADLVVAELEGDSAALEDALGWMIARGVKNPRALARMLIPDTRHSRQ